MLARHEALRFRNTATPRSPPSSKLSYCKCNLFNVNNTGVLVQSPEPEAHDKVLDNNPDRIGIWKCWFLRRGENRSTRRKTSRSKDENRQQTHMTPSPGIEPGPHWWEACVGGKCSTTAPSLLP